MLNLSDREWKEFFIGNLFTIKRPKARSEKLYQTGNIPFVASGNIKNGVTRCCTPQFDEVLDIGNCITVSPIDGSAFYQEANFLGRGGAGSSVLLLYNDHINRFSGLFLSKMVRQTCAKYCYGKMGNQESIKREKILLPVDEHDLPDYNFMADFSKEEQEQRKDKYISYLKNECKKIKYSSIADLQEKNWSSFYISDIFTISSGQRFVSENMHPGKLPFIGAVDSGNGITNYISGVNSSLDKNVLGVNYDGNGMVISFYHQYECLFSDSVKRFHLNHCADNKFILLFMKTVILQQRSKYNYGYKFNEQRMKRQKILLPVNGNGNPDYEYMEQYTKNLMLQKYHQYFDYINS